MKAFNHLKVLFTFLLFFIAIGMQAGKSPETEKKVMDYLGKESYDFVMQKNPDIIKYYYYFIENSFYITDVPKEKAAGSNPDMQTAVVPLKPNGEVDLVALNVLKLNLKRDFYNRTYYLIEGTQKLLVFYSEVEFMENFNKAKSTITI